MSEPTNQELKDLILSLDKKSETQLLQLDKKIDVQFAELKGEIKRVEEKLTGEIKCVDERLNGIEKRLGNEEFISRSAFTALIASVMAGLTKYLFFSSSPGL
jgi:hypothetical protein